MRRKAMGGALGRGGKHDKVGSDDQDAGSQSQRSIRKRSYESDALERILRLSYACFFRLTSSPTEGDYCAFGPRQHHTRHMTVAEE